MVAGEERPVHRRHRTVDARLEPAATARIPHLLEIRGPAHVGLRRHAREAVGPHREDIGLDHPVPAVDVGAPEPVAQFARRHAREGREVREHHQSRDVVAPAFLPDIADDMVEALESALAAPPRRRQRLARGERVRPRASVDTRRWRRLRGPRAPRPPRDAAVAGRLERRLVGAHDGAEAIGLTVDPVDELAPADQLPHEALLARERQVERERVR